MPGTDGNWGQVWINGIDVTVDTDTLTLVHQHADNVTMPQNVGVEQHSPGLYQPTYTQHGFARRGPGVLSAHNLLSPSGLGNVNDTEFIIMAALGQRTAPVQGDIVDLFDGTLVDYQRLNPLTGNAAVQGYQAPFTSRGKRMPPFPILMDKQTALKTATSTSNTPYDDGAESTSTALGAVAVLEVFTPTGVAATGNIGVPTQPVANDTVVINGTTFTWVAALSAVVGQVFIGTTALASAQNLWAAITGGLGNGTTYVGQASGLPFFPQLPLATATAFFAPPTGVNNTINITYAITGTGGNAFTLTKTGTGGLTVSGATLTGGVAGDTYNIVVASSASSGGSYTSLAAFNGVGGTRTAQRVEVAIGVAILEFIKVTYTLASGAGTSQTMGCAVAFGRFFNL